MERSVGVSDMLEARDRRAEQQRKLLEKYQSPLICFTMNIAGPVKNNAQIRRGFLEGLRRLKNGLSAAGIPILFCGEAEAFTGSEAFLAVKCSAETAKAITSEIEDADALGRLFDMDVLDRTGRKLEREALFFPRRRCLLCEREAKDCARSRTHTVSELQRKTGEILSAALLRTDSETVAESAVRALLYEAVTTPKPGLVDCCNSGSHKDMDIFSFMSSAASLYTYFYACAETGLLTSKCPPAETFQKLQRLGRQAEGRMLEATGGVNTHKGAIFSLGTLSGAVGRLPRERWGNAEAVLLECGRMTAGITERAFRGLTEETAKTAGERLYLQYGIKGARGQAEQGFPAVLRYGLPVLEEGIRRGNSLNDAGCAALLSILAHETDTNMIKRSDWQTQQEEARLLRERLRQEPYPDYVELMALDKKYIERNLSPGGSADLLAMCYFLYFLK